MNIIIFLIIFFNIVVESKANRKHFFCTSCIFKHLFWMETFCPMLSIMAGNFLGGNLFWGEYRALYLPGIHTGSGSNWPSNWHSINTIGRVSIAYPFWQNTWHVFNASTTSPAMQASCTPLVTAGTMQTAENKMFKKILKN